MSRGPWSCTLEELAKATGGRIVKPVIRTFNGVGTDTRENLTGLLYVPLKGDNFDGHDYVKDAVEKGAVAVLYHKWRDEWEELKDKAAFVEVKNTLKALQEFATFWRKKNGFKVVGITGSNGKTSTKEFTAALLKKKFRTHASKGSFNNHWGVPLTLLSASQDIEVVVCEMGMNHAGEITILCGIAQPDVVVVTTVGRSHIGELGSSESIAHAKEEIYESSPRALKIFNMDNQWTMTMETRYAGKKLKFSSVKPSADVYLRAERLTWEGLELTGEIKGLQGSAWIKVIGRQNTGNLMAAACVGLALGMKPQEIWVDFMEIKDTSWGRNQVIPMQNGARVLFDAYNANPDSLDVLLKNLFEMDIEGRKFLVMGDMRELGKFAKQSHFDAGEMVSRSGFEGVWYIGQHAGDFTEGFGKNEKPSLFLTSPDFDPQLAAQFYKTMKADDLVAVKGSRGMKLERVVEAWPLAAPLGEKP